MHIILQRSFYSYGDRVSSSESFFHEIKRTVVDTRNTLLRRLSTSGEKEAASLSVYRVQDKNYALDAVAELANLKKSSGLLSEGMMVDQPLIAGVMSRYGMRDIDELNEWLEQF